ncbi:hypothetical protein K435DRAFT_424949 [Dendrothele bispora CBS 962.96]|uniref:INO80 complex subunit B-like conserved region domain-containing protein n=1 Tax=Dendrothele bispora (strain CBS 962.96) TaxID=1314807 RepID=A0A4S8L4V5_DENBC|nr:hypothetical protein K435DRAFT_424949 [Dendrothele bispora CBS 962.96]
MLFIFFFCSSAFLPSFLKSLLTFSNFTNHHISYITFTLYNFSQLETINRLLKKQTRPRTRRAGGPSGRATPLGPLGPSSSTATTGKSKAKRGGKARGGGGRAGGRATTAGGGGEEEEEGGENMEVDAEGEEGAGAGEGVEGEEGEGEEVEGEEDEEVLVEQGAQLEAGMVRARGGKVVPMYRWISSVRVDGKGTAMISVVEEKKEMKVEENTSVDQGIEKQGDDKDVQMADDTNVSAAVDQDPSKGQTQNGVDVVDVEAKTTKSDSSKPIEETQKHMVLSFSVPITLLPSSLTPAPTSSMPQSGSVSRAETPTVTDTVPATKSTPVAHVRPPAAMCAVDGCGVKRKYRLVSDWTKGACGMEHLKVLEGKV